MQQVGLANAVRALKDFERIAFQIEPDRSVRRVVYNETYGPTKSGNAPDLGVKSRQFQANSIERLIDIARAPGAEVEIEPEYRIYRDTGIALTRRGQANTAAKEFIAFLQYSEGAAIFRKWGWIAGTP